MKEFKHVISLGYFCSVAQELEKMGFRDTSSPFDWVISRDFEQVIKLIENDFENYLNFDYLYQQTSNRNYYYNIITHIQFFHDFYEFEPLFDQLPKIKKKYQRRINLFYNNIKEPTLFIRYLPKVEEEKEIKYIENNFSHINKLLKKFNANNEIIFVSSNDLESSIVKLYKVEPDKGLEFATEYIKKSEELSEFLEKKIIYSEKKRKNNTDVYIKKNQFSYKKIYNKIQVKIKRVFLKKYDHHNMTDQR